MRHGDRLVYVAIGVVVAIVLVSTIVDMARRGSWGPAESMAWFPAVLIAVAGAGTRTCRFRRGTRW